ncbi:MAG: transcription termination/antitermination factor NusG [Ignavibacteriales bacterium]|nr:transcription termination/antitermination factor NusG [Ignavibacteriales bacterium]
METTEKAVDAEKSARWYVVHCVTGSEAKVKSALEKRITEEGMGEKVLGVFVPSEKVVEIHEGKKRSKVKTFLPGYILIQVYLEPKTRDFILQTPYILHFVGDKNKPVPLRNDEVKRFLGKTETEGVAETTLANYYIGMAVKIVDGPFNNFIGTVQEVNHEKMRLKVMVSIFGRKTPVELDFIQIEEVK